MNILWNSNPFLTKIELDDKDKKMLLLAYQNEEYVNILCELDMHLDGKFTKRTPLDLDGVSKQVKKWTHIHELDIESEEIQDIISYLNYIHMGDCTCVPCSCARCYAEELLDINTLPGLGKHMAHAINSAFFRKDSTRTIDEAIEYLKTPYEYKDRHECYKDYSEEKYMPLTVRWNKDREAAASWLMRYKEDHGF